jgi:hypothetical protein
MEKALEGLRPIAAYGTSPPPGGAGLAVALSRASSAGPLPTAAEANNEDRMTHEQPVDLHTLILHHPPQQE